MAREFSWDRRAHEMVAVYEELARTGERASRRTASGAPP